MRHGAVGFCLGGASEAMFLAVSEEGFSMNRATQLRVGAVKNTYPVRQRHRCL